MANIKALRLQNKYRSTVACHRDRVNKIIARLNRSKIPYFDPYLKRVVTGTEDDGSLVRLAEYIGTLEMKAEARGGMLRLFLRLVDGRKIITPVFWWQGYLGFYEMDNGTRLRLVYGQSSKGSTYLKQIEKL